MFYRVKEDGKREIADIPPREKNIKKYILTSPGHHLGLRPLCKGHLSDLSLYRNDY